MGVVIVVVQRKELGCRRTEREERRLLLPKEKESNTLNRGTIETVTFLLQSNLDP